MYLVNRRSAFSLIELLISVTVILTTTGMVIAGYSAFNAKQKLQQAGKTLQNDLRFVQTQATSGFKPTGCSTLLGYTVSFTEETGISSYSYEALCVEGLVPPIKKIKLPAEIKFLSSPPASFNFQVLTGTVDSKITITLSTVRDESNTYPVVVDQSGTIGR